MKLENRKRGRRPSPLLWGMVKAITDDEWRQIKAFSEVYGKGSKQFQLLEYLREQEQYDYLKEKEEFPDVSLGSMRNTARKWLIRTARRLAFYQSEVAEETLDIEVILQWGFPEAALEQIGYAKELAVKREEFVWLSILYKHETALVKKLYNGEKRKQLLNQIVADSIKNAKLMLLETEVAANTMRYVENQKLNIIESGRLKKSEDESYFESDFFKSKIDAWPIKLQLEKLRIDEFNFYVSQRIFEAANTAEQALKLFKNHTNVHENLPFEEAKCLFRLSTYYSNLGDYSGVEKIIDQIRARNPNSPQNKDYYLRRYLYMLFHLSFDCGRKDLAEEGVGLWEANFDYFEAQRKDDLLIIIMLLLTAYYLSISKIKKAKELWYEIERNYSLVPDLAFQSVFRILHLIILLDDNDIRGLASYGKNYKRYLKQKLPNTEPAIAIIELLCKQSNLEKPSMMQLRLKKVLIILEGLKSSKKMTFEPFIAPIIEWTSNKINSKNHG